MNEDDCVVVVVAVGAGCLVKSEIFLCVSSQFLCRRRLDSHTNVLAASVLLGKKFCALT
jgi:hypothetical protein